MKWFKHDTTSLINAKIEKLIMKYGIEGYGLYFACIELIAGSLTNENISFELKHDSEILAYKFKIDTIKIEEMMEYMVSLKLFGIDAVSNRITCYKLAERIDSSLIKNPQLNRIKKEIREKRENSRNPEKIREDPRRFEKMGEKSSQIRLDKIRLDKNILKAEKKTEGKQIKNQKIKILLKHWNESGLMKHSESTIMNNIKPKQQKIIDSYPVDVLCSAVTNYATVCKSPDYFWDWSSWTLLEFITRGLIKFLPESNPLEKFKNKEKIEEEHRKEDDKRRDELLKKQIAGYEKQYKGESK